MNFIIFFPILFAVFAFADFAKATITFAEGGITGVSLFDATEKKIYGGIAGLCAAPSSTSTCNTCTDTSGGLKPCNKTAVHSALTISFTFTSSVDLAATSKKVTLKVGNDTVGKDFILETAGLAAEKSYTIQTTWQKYCQKVAAVTTITGIDSDCNLSGVLDVVSTGVNFYLYEDATETVIPVAFHGIPSSGYTGATSQTFGGSSDVYGLYKYSFRAGDSKLILQEGDSTLLSQSMPSGTPELYAIAYFLDVQDNPDNLVDTSNFANGKNYLATHRYDKNATSTNGNNPRLIDGPYIENLQNGFQYCVVAGQINKTQNIFAFTTDGVDSALACATPNPVVGILEDKKCFISTAAFGSDMADEVVLFRKFRDAILLKTSLGKSFVKTYYKFSPPFADFIARSEFLRALSRAGLYPLLGFAWLSLQIGFLPTLFFALLLLIGIFHIRKNLRWSFGK